MQIRRFQVQHEDGSLHVEAIVVSCGNDLVVVVVGGTRYHLGAAALSISLPSIKDPARLTNSTYLVPVPGHKEEDLARDGSLLLSKHLRKNVVVTVGIHVDEITKDTIQGFKDHFFQLMEMIRSDYQSGEGK